MKTIIYDHSPRCLFYLLLLTLCSQNRPWLASSILRASGGSTLPAQYDKDQIIMDCPRADAIKFLLNSLRRGIYTAKIFALRN